MTMVLCGHVTSRHRCWPTWLEMNATKMNNGSFESGIAFIFVRIIFLLFEFCICAKHMQILIVFAGEIVTRPLFLIEKSIFVSCFVFRWHFTWFSVLLSCGVRRPPPTTPFLFPRYFYEFSIQICFFLSFPNCFHSKRGIDLLHL